MTKLYYYIFYKIYKLLFLIDPKEDRNVMSASFGLTSIIGYQIAVIVGLVNRYFFKLENFAVDAILIIIAIAILVFNYFVFERNDRYMEIIKLFEEESKTRSIIGEPEWLYI